MKKQALGIPWSLILMCGSLILLLCFQFLWLKDQYSDTQQALQNEVDHLFLDAVRGIEDSIFHEVYVTPLISGKQGDSIKVYPTWHEHSGKERFSVKKFTQKKVVDTAKVVTILQRGEFNHIIRDSNVSMSIRADVRTDKPDRKKYGSLSLFLSLDDSLRNTQKDIVVFRTSSIKPMLTSRLEENIRNSDLSLAYQFLETNQQDSNFSGLVTQRYVDIPSGKAYAVRFEGEKGYVLRQLIPQILFSLVLFCSIALTFFLIYRSLLKQKRLTQLKNDFISNITHELKTPITTVGVAIEALSSFDALQSPERTREYLDISKQELNRLTILVDKVLKMAMFDQKEPELKIESLDIKELVQDILASMKLQFDKFAAEVRFQFSDGGFEAEGDRIHLTSVIYNLLDNALKYSHHAPHIQVGLAHQGEQLMLTVQDNGVGISPEYKDKVFDKFFRIPTGDQHNVKGYGLGLSYVASVVQQHNGSIKVDSQPGQGTCFTIYLPTNHA